MRRLMRVVLRRGPHEREEVARSTGSFSSSNQIKRASAQLVAGVSIAMTVGIAAASAAGVYTQLADARNPYVRRAAANGDLHVMIWTATSPGHPTLLLVPTIHRLALDDPRLNVALGALADKVQAVVLEAPLDASPDVVGGVFRRHGIYATEDNLANHTRSLTAARLAQCARQSGLDVFRFFHLKPWLAALAVTFRPGAQDAGTPDGAMPQALNYDGIDQRLSEIAKTKGIPLIYLESTERAFNLYIDMVPDEQEALLSASCDTVAGVMVPGNLDMVAAQAAWVSGNAQELGRLITARDPNESDQLYAANQYMFRTNTDIFAEALASDGYFQGKGPILIAVGAGHFFGAASLPDRLKAAGYTITPPVASDQIKMTATSITVQDRASKRGLKAPFK
ncbi:TraB/GumN family protein [Pararobbsia alpina]